MSRRRACVRALAVVAALAAAVPATASAKVRTGPAGEAFYTPPAPLPAGRHGDVIWARGTKGAVVAPGAGKSTLVLYRSQGIDGPTAVSGVVQTPKGKAPKNGWPVITFAHGTTGIADSCAPSRAVAGTATNAYSSYILPLVTRWLKAGYAVVRTDYEGLGTPGTHPYLIGDSEGRATLDIVRAARQLDDNIGKSTIISGHSQGGHAALFAAALAPKYAKGDVKLKGTVAFAPASRLDEQIPITTVLTSPGGGLSGLIATITRGLQAANPTLDPATILSDQALALYPRTLTECLGELSQPSAFGGLAPKDLFKAGLDFGPIAKLLDAQDPSNLTIRTPLLIEQGASDQTVIPLFTDGLVKDLAKRAGKAVTYKKYAGADHVAIVNVAAKDATAFIAKRLR